MSTVANPALAALISQIGAEFLFAQVIVRGNVPGFELRHVTDRLAAEESLRAVKLVELRALARSTQTGGFRALEWASIRGVLL